MSDGYTKVFGNIDLVRMIYGFGDGHREKMARVVLKTNLEDVMNEYCRSHYHTRKVSSFITFLKESYTVKKRRKLLGRLQLCHCCSRHSHYKDVPIKPDDPVPESKKVDICHCNCRHWYRVLRLAKVLSS